VYLEHGQPESKIILSLNYKIKKWGFILRNTRFGETAFQNVDKPKETFSPKILTDFSISCAPKPWLSLTAGANNIFDVYPDRIKDYGNTSEGMFIYATQASPFGYNGGYYFVSTNFNF
jgi:iron complex outermembrane receptor protein